MTFSEDILPKYTFLVLTNLEVLKHACFIKEKKTLYPGDANWGASEWKVKHFFKVLH